MKRFALFRALLSAPIIATIVLMAFSAAPTFTAQACLPCNCTDIRSHNCFGPYHLYTPTRGESCEIDLWLFEGDRGRRYVRVTNSELAKLPANPEQNMLVKERGVIALYKLTTGEYQVNVGPDAEGKIYVVNFDGCPAENVRETNFQVARPGE
ncbi:MAG: hypothetical protein SGJ24_10865 [Chloroflexota bacterium]|nr:hypothetical protein [Chloroflexota bacterium]